MGRATKAKHLSKEKGNWLFLTIFIMPFSEISKAPIDSETFNAKIACFCFFTSHVVGVGHCKVPVTSVLFCFGVPTIVPLFVPSVPFVSMKGVLDSMGILGHLFQHRVSLNH